MSKSNRSAKPDLPRAPIDRVAEPLSRFLHVEAASGVVLLVCTVVALCLANSPLAPRFLAFWATEVGFTFGDFEFHHSLQYLINDGLMTVFFFVIGLEVKRELVLGELRDVRRAALPIAAALGGMVAPAFLYLAYVANGEGQRGWGIPMATDIAFVVGCMAILGPRVPRGLRVMLLSLAIADDIGAILVIAIGYTDHLSFSWLVLGLVGMALILAASRLGIRRIPVYVLIGMLVWFAFHESGVHATVAGVILGLMTPARTYVSEGLFGDVLRSINEVFEGGTFGELPHRAEKVRRFQRITRETISPLEYLEATLHPWTSFVIMPVFALANAGVPIHLSELGAPVALAVMLGLVLGKPLGIVVFSAIAVRVGMAKLPEGVNWSMMVAAGCLAGIGFTMALFIAGLALSDALLDTAKIGVLAGSALSAVIGMTLLRTLLPTPGASA
jgi:NhaA family Na+:H+ antiporter